MEYSELKKRHFGTNDTDKKLTDEEITDEEIIKALECCSTLCCECDECPLYCVGVNCSSFELHRYALDLINRQKEEIEALYQINAKSEKEIYEIRKELLGKENLEESFKRSVRDFDKRLEKTVKLERVYAYKEFAEKLEEKLCDCRTVSDGEYCGFDCGDTHECIDVLLEEMVGERK